MNASKVLEAVNGAGGSLELCGDRIRYVLPDSAKWLVKQITRHKEDLIDILRKEAPVSTMPPGVRLMKWAPKEPPIAIVRMGVVTDVHKFIAATLLQVKARLQGKDFLAGSWSLRDLIDRLEQVGVEVAIERDDFEKNSHE